MMHPAPASGKAAHEKKAAHEGRPERENAIDKNTGPACARAARLARRAKKKAAREGRPEFRTCFKCPAPDSRGDGPRQGGSGGGLRQLPPQPLALEHRLDRLVPLAVQGLDGAL